MKIRIGVENLIFIGNSYFQVTNFFYLSPEESGTSILTGSYAIDPEYEFRSNIPYADLFHMQISGSSLFHAGKAFLTLFRSLHS
ncbi:hypothetical protein MSSIT_2619 [Methanosarcina siciliae T4/M]|uniref:Uncharacterized protein n=2 Tax=Methanosarcina siciliae TaxID=38027 RepID=A0A0E3PF61_9EURY|nr:hypothetical protein MSSIT_2619 [Methanosarcina siciliae T4/M]AKB33270.1 hypothetical protein MSSIH_2580 [Methanosarcina siciliae HI350]